jgi:hypothetical protein
VKQAEDTFTAELPLGEPAPADLPIPAPVPAWRRALDAAIAADPRGRQGIAERLEVTRAYVSRVAGGDLTDKPPPKFISRVQAVLMQVDCPFLGRPIPPDQCRAFAARSYAQIKQPEVAHWRACMRCTARAPYLPPARTHPAHQSDQGDEK